MMKTSLDFVIGGLCQAEARFSQGAGLVLSFAANKTAIDGMHWPEHPALLGANLVEVGIDTPEEAYMLGKALLMIAKSQGVSD